MTKNQQNGVRIMENDSQQRIKMAKKKLRKEMGKIIKGEKLRNLQIKKMKSKNGRKSGKRGKKRRKKKEKK